MATSISTSLASITNYYKVLSESQPNAIQLANEAARIDNGDTTLAKTLLDLYNSPSRVAGHANEWAEAFFVLTGRAPDYATYMQGMDILRAGTSFTGLMDTVLALPGHRLSTHAIASSKNYINTLYALLTNGEQLPVSIQDAYAALIDNGSYTRGEVLALTLENGSQLLHGGRENKVQQSLTFLAAASKEATGADLLLATGSLHDDVLHALASVGLSTPAGYAFFAKPSSNSSIMEIKGELSGDLIFNLQADTYSLGGLASFKAYFSGDGGVDAGLVNFGSFFTDGVVTLDASAATGKGKLIANGQNNGGSYHFTAPVGGSTLQGANGNDTLIGGAGVDKLVATQGNDSLTGGAGIDTFVFAQAAYYRNGDTKTIVTDFGNGLDVLDFSLLLGAKAPSATKIAPVLATSTLLSALANGGVALVESDGLWTNGAASVAATANDVAALFGAAGTVFRNPGTASRHVIITADLATNGAEIWLINNETAVAQIASNEIFLIGQIDGDWNLMLNGLLPIIR